jgi:parvulin-like peptidyl-prolyl isomerase
MMGLNSCKQDIENSANGVVATVGSFEISDKHFENQLKRFYLRMGQAVNLNEQVRLSVINSRIERYAIVEYASDLGWATDVAAIYNRSMIERKVYIEEYQRRFIYDRIQVTDQDIREVFRRSNASIRASHLLASTPDEAEKLVQRLKQGESFETLAAEVFNDPALRSTGGDLGYFGIDEMDLAFEDAAFSLRKGEVSKPIRTTTGFSIIKVTDVIEAPLLTEVQFAQQRPQMEQVAHYQEQERATRRDLENTLNQMEWNESTIADLWGKIQNNPVAFYVSDVSLSELPVSINESDRSKVIAQLRGFRFTVEDFLTEAYFTPSIRRNMAQREYDFRSQLEGLAYRSYALGLVKNHPDLDENFINESINETFYGYLFDRFESDIDTKVDVDQNQIRSVYNQNSEQFSQPLMLDMSEIVLTDAKLAENVFARLNSGADFKTMLDEFGADTDTKKQGGYIGNIPINQFGTMASALGKIQPGELAGPFQVANNYFIILKCNGRTESRPLAFEQAEDQVREYVFSKERQLVRDQIISNLRTRYNAQIDMNRLNTISFQL